MSPTRQPQRRAHTLLTSVFLLLALSPTARAVDKDLFTGAARVVAVGDIHGDQDKFLAVLRLARLIDDKGDWIGGQAHLVQTGDILDRGPDSRKVMDHLMRLETQARKAGGHVHALIGNHEAMNLIGDLRYVSDGEFAAFGDPPRGTPIPRVPTGSYPGLQAAFSPQGKYGAWILTHNAIVKIDGTLFLHGGISPKYQGRDLHEINQAIRQELAGRKDPRTGIAMDPDGPLWYRGLAESGQEQVQKRQVQQLLTGQKARRMVIGHTVQDLGITLRYDDQLILIDVGMSSRMLNAPAACLLIEPGHGGSADKISILK